MVYVHQKRLLTKKVSNIQEVKARGGRLIVIATEGDDQFNEIADDVIYIPFASNELTPLISVVPLQLLSYHIALKLGVMDQLVIWQKVLL